LVWERVPDGREHDRLRGGLPGARRVVREPVATAPGSSRT